MKSLLKQLGLDAVYGLDFETYYDDEYSLRKMPTTEYICDSRFEAQILSIQKHSWAAPKVLTGAKAIQAWTKTVDWSRTGMLGHHTQFDGLIASRHFDVHPKFYLDTLSMARPLMPVQVGGSLHALALAFGLQGKTRAQALANVKGKRLKDFTKTELRELALYAGDDIAQTWQIFHKLKSYLPVDELRLIDLTIKMYARPVVVLNGPKLQAIADEAVRKKAAALDRIGADKSALMSNDKFADLLRANGVVPPTKVSKTTGKETYAFAKNDLEFQALLDHEDAGVVALVEARLGVKSTIVETRAQRLANRAAFGPASVYLNYCGAKTWRWSGGDGANWQNFNRDSGMREAIEAPKGYQFVIADLSQIEARMNAWFSRQEDLLDQFRANDAGGEDVYCAKYRDVFRRSITKADKPERFLAKVMVLMLQYGAGGPRFYEFLRSTGVDVTLSQATDITKAYRATIPMITANWRSTWNHIRSAFAGQQRLQHGVVAYEGFEGRGVTYMPDGVSIRYDKLEIDDEGISYATKWRRRNDGKISETRQRLYGGLCVENNIQCLSRIVIARHMLDIADALPAAKLVMSTHDEIVAAVPTRAANKSLRVITDIMSTPPAWAPDLPIAVEAHLSQRYDK